MKGEITLVTSDFKLVSRLLTEAARRGLRIIHASNPSEIPLKARVLIMKRAEMIKVPVNIPIVYADDYTTATSVLDRAVEIAAGRNDARTATISIDPGRRIGLAYIVGDYVVRTESFTDITGLERSVAEFMANHSWLEVEVVIGSGAPEYRDAVLAAIRRMPSLGDAPITIVPEEGTSRIGPGGKRRRMSDEHAASVLAMRKRHVKHKP